MRVSRAGRSDRPNTAPGESFARRALPQGPARWCYFFAMNPAFSISVLCFASASCTHLTYS